MQISISARHGQLSPSTQDKISEKVDKLRRYNDRLTAVEVTVDLEHREKPSVELRVAVERSNDLIATADATTALSALDGAMHKIEQQIRKHKEKITSRRVSGLKHSEIPLDAEPRTE